MKYILTDYVNEYEQKMEKTQSALKKQFGEFALDEDFNGEQFELLKSAFEMIQAANKLVCAQAKVIQEMDKKLDKLMAKD